MPCLVRERIELLEQQNLSPLASLSAKAARTGKEGRLQIHRHQRDNDRIIRWGDFGRPKHKTQVFLSPEGDHYRAKLTHTLEVSRVRGQSRVLCS